MKILESWFYNLSNKDDNNIVIWDNINIIIFDAKDIEREIIIWKNTRLEFYGSLNNSDYCNKQIILKWDNSQLKLWYLLFAWLNQTIKAKISWIIRANNTKVNLKIISMVLNDSKVDIDWVLQIDKWFKQAVWKLEENNIFLWEKWIINSIPNLFVRSKDVNMSHSCKIEKINDEELFYLRSKWIAKNVSLQMILNSYVNDLFKCLKMLNNEFYEELVESVKGRILLH